jgi:hypothetical protein
MSYEVAIGTADAQVRTARLRQALARGTGGTTAYVVINPLAPPRLWGRVADEVATAFERAVDGLPPGPSLVARAAEAAGAAVERLRAQLIEPKLLLDAQLAVLAVGPEVMHIGLTTGVRIYRARGGMPERLFPRAPRPEGASAGGLFNASEPVLPGDLLVLGTRETFTVRSIGNLATVLSRAPRPPVSELCEAVVAPCRDVGIGGATVVLRRV